MATPCVICDRDVPHTHPGQDPKPDYVCRQCGARVPAADVDPKTGFHLRATWGSAVCGPCERVDA